MASPCNNRNMMGVVQQRSSQLVRGLQPVFLKSFPKFLEILQKIKATLEHCCLEARNLTAAGADNPTHECLQ